MANHRFGERRRPLPGGRTDARVGECLVAVFLLGVALFSPLVVGIFDGRAKGTAFAVPVLYFYMFAAWTLLILLIALVIERPTERLARLLRRFRQQRGRP